MISDCVTPTVLKQTLASDAHHKTSTLYGALLCLLSQHVLERDLSSWPKLNVLCRSIFNLHILWIIFSKFALLHFSLPHHPEEEGASSRICISTARIFRAWDVSRSEKLPYILRFSKSHQMVCSSEL